MTQICPFESAVMPPTWPMIQLFGSGFGQLASTAKVGTSPAPAGCENASAPASAAAAIKAVILRFGIGAMATLPKFLLRIFPLRRGVNSAGMRVSIGEALGGRVKTEQTPGLVIVKFAGFRPVRAAHGQDEFCDLFRRVQRQRIFAWENRG